MPEELTAQELTQYPISRCSVSQITVDAMCPGPNCKKQLSKKIYIGDEVTPNSVITCTGCKRSWLIVLNVNTSVEAYKTKLVRVNL